MTRTIMLPSRNYRLLRTAAVAAALLLSCLAGAMPCHAQPASSAVSGLLPDAGFHSGWNRDGAPETYSRETLYEHINGEAELYLPYGFDEAAAGYYIDSNNSKSGIAIDIYRMGSRLDAFGIYASYRNPETLPAGFGVEGEISDTQASFFQDRYFVRITASGRVPPARDVLRSCANAVASKLPAPSGWPSELDLIRAAEPASRTEKFVAGSLLGYRFFPRGLTADGILDGKPVKLFVVLAESPASAAACLAEYEASLQQPGGAASGSLATAADGTLSVQDPLYRHVVIRQSGSRLFGVAKADDPARAADRLSLWLSHLK